MIALTLKTLPSAVPTGEFQPLEFGYRGIEHVVSTFGPICKTESDPEMEFVGASIYETNDQRIQRELAAYCTTDKTTHLHGGGILLDFIPAVEVLEQMDSIEDYEQLFQDDGLQDNYVENHVAFSLHSWRGCQIVGDRFRVISVSASFCKMTEVANTDEYDAEIKSIVAKKTSAWKMEYRVITEGAYCSTKTHPINKKFPNRS